MGLVPRSTPRCAWKIWCGRAVHATHAGRPVAEVDAELRRRFAECPIEPLEPAFSELVQAIAAGEPV